MKILCIGDVVGEPGRRVVARLVPKVVLRYQIDLVIANGENLAGGFGITPEVAEELFDAGVSVITLGNHAWDKKQSVEFIHRDGRIIRPANYPPGVPGQGSLIVETAGGTRVGILQVMGRVFMPTLDCPFRVARQEVSALKASAETVIVDMHAETTSEKMAMGHYLDGEVSAVVGTHTHVQTADEQLLPKGTAYVTDIGMTGPRDSVIGMKKDMAIEKFLTQMPRRLEVASGPAVLCAVVIEIDGRSGKAKAIQRLQLEQ